VSVDVLTHGAGHRPLAVPELRRLLRRRAINLLHVHGYKATVVGVLASRGLGIKVVKTEHGRLERPAGWRDLPGFAKLWAYTALDRLASSALVDGVVFVSRDIAETGGRWRTGVPRRVIYNGLAPASRDKDPHAAPRDAAFNMGIVGRLTKVKGHQHLLNALALLTHLDDLKLHIFGTGPLHADYRRMAEERGLNRKVVFHGFEPAIQEKMAALDLLIIPSEHEGLPYVVLEAMYLKVPIVASRVGGLREALQDGDCGILVAPKDPAALAAAIEHAYRHPELRTRLASKAHARLRRDFLASVMVRQYALMYRTVVGY
jgi:glycosyltransferase involved in cell wall biosynthesis